jgi:hypothetical protein
MAAWLSSRCVRAQVACAPRRTAGTTSMAPQLAPGRLERFVCDCVSVRAPPTTPRCSTSARTRPHWRPTSSSSRPSGVRSWVCVRVRGHAHGVRVHVRGSHIRSRGRPSSSCVGASAGAAAGRRCWGCPARTCGPCRRGGRRPTPPICCGSTFSPTCTTGSARAPSSHLWKRCVCCRD